jgi:hypothetical protein
MEAQDFRGIQEAYMEVVINEGLGGRQSTPDEIRKRPKPDLERREAETDAALRSVAAGTDPVSQKEKADQAQEFLGSHPRKRRKKTQKEQYDIYDIILSHLLDEGYAETPEAAEAIMVNMSEEWRDDIMEKEDSEYEKASDAALDSRYGYGRASGDKRSFGRAANRSSAAAALRAIRRGERSGSGTSTEAGADAVHQGWAKTAKTSSDQTPEKKARRAGLANTPYSKLPDDEKEKDRVSFNAVKAIYNNKNR